MNQLPETGFLRLPQILGDAKRNIPPLIPVCKTVWWQGCRTGRFPAPIRLSRKCTVWKAEDIRSLIAKIAQEGRQ